MRNSTDNKRRQRLARLLGGFGYRVQESSFEAILTKSQLAKLRRHVQLLIQRDDNVRIYKIRGNAAVTIFGVGHLASPDDHVFV